MKIGQKSVDSAKKKSKLALAGELKKAKSSAWKALSLYVRKRDRYCVCCGSPFNLQGGHLIKRGRGTTFLDVTNVNAQCADCNIRHNNYPEHYTNWWIKKYGQKSYDELVAKSWQLKDWTVEELQELEDGFNRLTQELEEQEKLA